jgi:hypothetical protein
MAFSKQAPPQQNVYGGSHGMNAGFGGMNGANAGFGGGFDQYG